MQGSPLGTGNVTLDKAVRPYSMKRGEGKNEKVVSSREKIV